MNNRVYGVIGIGSYMANWNADFTGHPKTLGTGIIFGSDKALKYSIRNHMNFNGAKVMVLKSFKSTDGIIQPRDIDERYELLFEKPAGPTAKNEEILKNLLSMDDVMNFGITYTGNKQNISILGVVQIGQAYNKFDETEIHTQDILSPYRDLNDKKAMQTTLGTQVIVDEAHYIYPFSINPKALDVHKNILPDVKYELKHYEIFKKAALEGATLLNTASKMGCENEFGLFVTFKENSKSYLPPLDSYIEVKKSDKIIYNIEKMNNLLKDLANEIDLVEIYYNKEKVEIEGLFGIDYIKKNIITKQKI